MGDLAGREGVAEGLADMVLTDDVVKGLRPVLQIEGLVGHSERCSPLPHQSLRRRRWRGAASPPRWSVWPGARSR